MHIAQHIFREYDIRGIMDKEIDCIFVRILAKVLAKYFKENGHHRILIGYDTRRNSIEYHNILCEELNKNDCDVISLGMIPSPCLYFAVHHLQIFAGIMITASHNDAPYNGFKLWQGKSTLYGESIQTIYQRMLKIYQEIEKDNSAPNISSSYSFTTSLNSSQMPSRNPSLSPIQNYCSTPCKNPSLDSLINASSYNKCVSTKQTHDIQNKHNTHTQQKTLIIRGISSYFDIKTPYTKALCEETGKLSCKVVVDGSNASAGKLCCDILTKIGIDVIALYCEPSSDFPNHPPDPTIAEHCKELCKQITEHNADYGIGLDGDGDRVVMVDRNGRILACDELLALFAKDMLMRIPNARILADVKCTHHLFKEIETLGGTAIMAPTGHSLMKTAMRREKAHIGGELSGHFFHAENWFGTDDGILTAVRALAILQRRKWDLTHFPVWKKSYATPEIHFNCPENKKIPLVEKAKEYYTKKYGEEFKVTCIDGVRVDFGTSWFLIRASHTSPVLTLRFEAQDKNALTELQSIKIQELTSWINALE